MNDIANKLEQMIQIWEDYFLPFVEFHEPIEFILKPEPNTDQLVFYFKYPKYLFEVTDLAFKNNKKKMFITSLYREDEDYIFMKYYYE